MKITVAILSTSEKINQQVLSSVCFADEIIIIVDSANKKSQKKGSITYYYHPLNQDFASQRNFALSKASNDWVLFVDDDEYVGTELGSEIRLLDSQAGHSGYSLKRLDVCFHQPLSNGETGNTRLIRLANKKKGQFQRPVHEFWNLTGRVGVLSSPLYHLKNNLVSGFIRRMDQYSEIDAGELAGEGKPFSYFRLFINPLGKFIQNYFVRQGLKDGTVGLFSAYLMSLQSLTVRLYQWEKNH